MAGISDLFRISSALEPSLNAFLVSYTTPGTSMSITLVFSSSNMLMVLFLSLKLLSYGLIYLRQCFLFPVMGSRMLSF